MGAARVEVKKRCCRDSPRCKRCPVAWKRLSKAGLATCESKSSYKPMPGLKKSQLKAARA